MDIENTDISKSQQNDTKYQNLSHNGTSATTEQPLSIWYHKIIENKKLVSILRTVLISSGSVAAVLFVIIFIVYLAPGFQELSSGGKDKIISDSELKKDQNYKKQIATLSRDVQRLSKKYSSYTSGLSYVVINTTDNRFYLYQNKKLIREGFCSSGSYTMLKTEGERKWIFKTPKGKYWIQGKITDPVWKRPDWSFVEEGLPIPSEDDPSRYEYGVLGDYALSIGDGYLIHGTLYKRFLGMPVTHGCVRLNDDDLKAIYNTLSIGSKVYIF
ncbi:MAG: L,D-transpeptidase [Bacteroidota bacterium]|nr:L,D-transpeptidase [Bacteroidota bacterium]